MPVLLRLLPILIPLARRALRHPRVRARLHLKPLPDDRSSRGR